MALSASARSADDNCDLDTSVLVAADHVFCLEFDAELRLEPEDHPSDGFDAAVETDGVEMDDLGADQEDFGVETDVDLLADQLPERDTDGELLPADHPPRLPELNPPLADAANIFSDKMEQRTMLRKDNFLML